MTMATAMMITPATVNQLLVARVVPQQSLPDAPRPFHSSPVAPDLGGKVFTTAEAYIKSSRANNSVVPFLELVYLSAAASPEGRVLRRLP